MPGAKILTNKTDVHLLHWAGSGGNGRPEAIIAAANKLENFIQSESDCSTTIMFAHSGNAVVGLYVGKEVHKPTAATIIKRFIDTIEENRSPGKVAVQLCRDSEDEAPNT